MHVITQKRVWEAKERYPTAASALDGWYRLIKSNRFGSFEELRRVFPSVDRVGDKYIFDISGNQLRLIANIHFRAQRLYIREILTHAEYDKGGWKR